MLILILLVLFGINALSFAFMWKYRSQIGGGLGRFNREKWGLEEEEREDDDRGFFD